MSGAWIVVGNTVCGMIFAVFDAEPRALILPIDLVIQNLIRLCPDINEVNIANGAQDKAVILEAMVECLKDPDSLVREAAIEGLVKQLTLPGDIVKTIAERLQHMENMLGKKHPSTLNSMKNLTLVLDILGKYEEAEKVHQETLELGEKVLGREHPDTLTSKNNLANMLREQGKYKEAGRLYQETLAQREKMLGEEQDAVESFMAIHI